MDTFLRDLKQSLRTFRQSPSFTITALAALAFGIGANIAIFSVVNAVLFKPLPYPDPQNLVLMMTQSPQGSGGACSPAKFIHYRAQTDVVQDVSAFSSTVMNFTGGDVPQQILAGRVSIDYFRLVGAPVSLGRSFTKEEDLPNGPKAVVLSHALWSKRFAGSPDIIGKTIPLSGDPYTVVGVMDQSFDVSEFGAPPDAWIAFQLDPLSTDQGHYFRAAGRLVPGVTVDQAKARLKASTADFRAKYARGLAPEQSFTVERFGEVLVRDVKETLLVLMGAVFFVLLIACVNVANLLLVRATGRRREIAIRFALGASRGRVIRQLLTESVLLSLIGGALGLLLGMFAIKALLAINTAGLPRIGENGGVVDVDWRVVIFTVAASIVTGIVFGLIPALQGSRADLGLALKEGGRTGTGGRGNRVRSVLVVTEIALALVLLVGSALLIRTSIALRAVDAGFDASNVLTMRMSLTGERFLKSSAVDQVIRDGVDRLQRLPGVEVASATCCVPLEGGYGLPFTIVGRPITGEGPYHGGGGWLTISPGYFEVFEIPVKRGRTFNDRDIAGGQAVAVINEAMAKQFWKDADPLADRIAIGRGVMKEFSGEPDRQIIGVVSDVRDGGLNNDPQPTMYIPQAQVPDAVNALNVRITPIAWVLRTRVNVNSLTGAIQKELREATGLPVSEVRSMDEVVSRSISRERFNMLVMTIFGGAALLLAAIGIYGLMSYSVEQRTQEIGIRLALGAAHGDVRKMIVFQGMRLAIIGVVVGVGCAFGLARFIASFLFGVKAWDPLVFISIPVLLTLVALFAVWRPAAKASRLDPMSALRTE
ncbi:MAG TPA: ABC transporter permease [Haliangiales bacterium]|nr:ABC transporter permease [Haliangiales bacterium]